MAYISPRGNQLVLVHGVREAKTGKVGQQILFTLYSKAEALEMLGRREQGTAEYFERLVEEEYPLLQFNWKKIRAAVAENLDLLPDLYQYREARLLSRFNTDLNAFARQLILSDPQEMVSAAELLKDHRYQLEYLSELIHWRLEMCDQEQSEWNGDNAFYYA